MDSMSILDGQGNETSRPVDKHVSGFVSAQICEYSGAFALCVLLTVWVDLIEVQESNTKAIQPPMGGPNVVLQRRNCHQPAVCSAHHGHATPAMISPHSSNGAR